MRFSILFILVLFASLLGFTTEVDCSDPANTYKEKCLRRTSCAHVKDIEFGGGQQFSNFETFSCAKLISMYEASEKEGNLKARMNTFIRKNGIQARFLSDCPKERSEARKKCVLGVYQIMDKYQADRDAFVAALRFKVAVYDFVFHSNRNDFLGDASCKKASALKSPRDYKYNKSDYQSDCEMIGLNSPSCFLKLGAQPQYPDSANSYLNDRQICQKFIEANTKVDNEPFSSGLKKDPFASESLTLRAAKKPDCSNFDPNNLKAFQANPFHLDTTLYCLDAPANQGESSSPNPSRGSIKTGR